MRGRILAGLVLMVGITVADGADPKPDYKQFASSAGRYKVLFPGPVKTDTTEVKSTSGTLTLTLDSVQLEGDIQFVVTYLDTPDDVAKQPVGPRLDKVRDGNKGTDGKVISEKELSLGEEKHPAREVVIQKPTAFIRNRIVIAGSRLYQVMIQGSKQFVTSKDADRFFDSFELTR